MIKMCKESISYHKSDMASFLIMILAILIIVIKNVSSSTFHKTSKTVFEWKQRSWVLIYCQLIPAETKTCISPNCLLIPNC